MTAAADYTARIDAYSAQRRRLLGEPAAGDRWSGGILRRFRMDPHRDLDKNLTAIAAHVRSDDVVIDVGGGAGRVGLPLALRCKELINVDPSPAMGEVFQTLAAESGIANARWVAADWLHADRIVGDVTLAANVTYFVRAIVPFIERLEAAARRQVIISIWSWPAPSRNAVLFKLVFGEDEIMAPGKAELLAVLWELGILPDVQVLDASVRLLPPPGQTPEEAVQIALQERANEQWNLGQAGDDRWDRAAGILRDRFTELFQYTPQGFLPAWQPPARELLITWPSGRRA